MGHRCCVVSQLQCDALRYLRSLSQHCSVGCCSWSIAETWLDRCHGVSCQWGCVCVELHNKNVNLLISCIYRSPSSSCENNDNINKLINDISSSKAFLQNYMTDLSKVRHKKFTRPFRLSLHWFYRGKRVRNLALIFDPTCRSLRVALVSKLINLSAVEKNFDSCDHHAQIWCSSVHSPLRTTSVVRGSP